MKKKLARKTRVDAEHEPIDGLEVRRRFAALRDLLGGAGLLDAVDVLDRAEAAVFHPDDRIAGQRRTHRGALRAMAEIASDVPDRRGRPETRAVRVFPQLVRVATHERADGRSDETIAIILVWCWVQTYGAPAELARATIADTERLRLLADDDAEKFVRNVHRALFPNERTDNLTNAKTQANARAQRAKRRSRRAA